MQIQLCCVSFCMNLSLLWFFRAAATEIGVLQDVLAVAREKRYLVLDPINSEMMEQRNLPVLLMLARKKVHFAFLLQYYKTVWLQSSSVSLLSLRFDRLLCICAVVCLYSRDVVFSITQLHGLFLLRCIACTECKDAVSCYRYSVDWSVSLCMHVSSVGPTVSPTKTAEPIKMPLGSWTRAKEPCFRLRSRCQLLLPLKCVTLCKQQMPAAVWGCRLVCRGSTSW